MQHKQNVLSKLSDYLENYLLLAPTCGARIYACNQHQKPVACEHYEVPRKRAPLVIRRVQ